MYKKGLKATFILICVLILTILFFMNIEPSYLGFIIGIQGEAGKVQAIVITPDHINNTWQGLYGNLTTEAIRNYTYVNATTNVRTLNLNLSKCVVTELYITNMSSINFSKLEPGNVSMVDVFLGLSSSNKFSGTSVFKYLRNFTVDDITMELPAAKTNAEQGDYYMGLLKQEHNFVIVTDISDLNKAFNGAYANYQIMVPVPSGTSNLKYNFFLDPSDKDECYYPVLNPVDNITIYEGEIADLNVSGYDPNNLDLTYTFTNPLNISLEFNSTGQWQTDYDDEGVYEVIIRLTNSKGYYVERKAIVTVLNTIYCGDGVCEGGETCASCQQDCGSCPPPPPAPSISRRVSAAEEEVNEACEVCRLDVFDLLDNETQELGRIIGLDKEIEEHIKELKRLEEELDRIRSSQVDFQEKKEKVNRINKRIKELEKLCIEDIYIDAKTAKFKHESIIIDRRDELQEIEYDIIDKTDFTTKEKSIYDNLDRKIHKEFDVFSEANRIAIEYVNGRKEKQLLITKTVVNKRMERHKPAKVIIIIPKYIAKNTSEIRILTENYKILEEDPILAWNYSRFNGNETKEYNILIKKNINPEFAKNIKVLVIVNDKALPKPKIEMPEIIVVRKPCYWCYWIIIVITTMIIASYIILNGNMKRLRFITEYLWTYDQKYHFEITKIIDEKNEHYMFETENNLSKKTFVDHVKFNNKRVMAKYINQASRTTKIEKKTIAYCLKKIREDFKIRRMSNKEEKEII